MIHSQTIDQLPEWFANVVWTAQESINGHTVKLSAASGGSATINVVEVGKNKYAYISDAAIPVGDERSFRLLIRNDNDNDNDNDKDKDRKKSGGGKEKKSGGGGKEKGGNKRKGVVQYDVLQARIFAYLEEYEPVNVCGDILTLESIINAVKMDGDEGDPDSTHATRAVERWFGYHPTRGGTELSTPNKWKIIGKQ
jgi:hypothetical protein